MPKTNNIRRVSINTTVLTHTLRCVLMCVGLCSLSHAENQRLPKDNSPSTNPSTSKTTANVANTAGAPLSVKEAYTPQRFAQLQQANAVILIDVYAPWCSTCAKQQALLQQMLQQNPKLKLHILQVSYDDDAAALQRFKIPRQSTMLLFKGKQQVWFSVAETRYQVILAAIKRAADL